MGAGRILVTGATGYLGGVIAKGLHSKGHDVLVAADAQGHLGRWADDLSRVALDWFEEERLETALQDCEVVIHAAGVNSKDSSLDPAAALEFNGVATTRLLTAAMRKGVRQFIYLSTAHVYSASMSGHLTETSPTNNLHPYATSHLAGEHSCRFYGGTGNIETVILRLSNVYGPPSQEPSRCWNLFVNDISRQAIAEGVIRVHGQPNIQRNFVSSDYLLSVLGWFLSNAENYTGSEIYNVGSTQSISLIRMAELVQQEAKGIIDREPLIMGWSAPEQNDDLSFDVRKLVQKTGLSQDDHRDPLRSLMLYCLGTIG
jgi:UDP-glucose 4-epimerase